MKRRSASSKRWPNAPGSLPGQRLTPSRPDSGVQSRLLGRINSPPSGELAEPAFKAMPGQELAEPMYNMPRDLSKIYEIATKSSVGLAEYKKARESVENCENVFSRLRKQAGLSEETIDEMLNNLTAELLMP